MRIAERQERQNAVAVENLPRRRLMRFFGANGGNQRMVAVIPESERDIGMLAQPRLAPSAPITRRAVSMRPSSSVTKASFSPHATCLSAAGVISVMSDRLSARFHSACWITAFSMMWPRWLKPHSSPRKAILPKLSRSHTSIALCAGAQLENVVPHADVLQQTLAGGIDGGDAQRRLLRRRHHVRLTLLQHRHAQPAALQAAGQRQPHHTATGDNHVK